MVSVHDQLAPTFLVGGKVACLIWSTWQSKLVTSSPGSKKWHVKKQGPTTPLKGTLEMTQELPLRPPLSKVHQPPNNNNLGRKIFNEGSCGR